MPLYKTSILTFASKKDDRAMCAMELVWRVEKLFADHITRMRKTSAIVDVKSKRVLYADCGTAIVK